MIRLNVWMRLPDGTVRLAGEVVATDPTPDGKFETEFEYATEWIDHPRSFDLDPASLPRGRNRRFPATSFQPPLAVFEDALPDDWGRRLMAIAIRAEGKKPTLPQFLRRMGADGVGALAFSDGGQPPQGSETADKGELAELLDAAFAFEAGRLPHDHRFRRLMEAGGTAGGARPKALLHDKGVEWIGKFPSPLRDEQHDVVGLEATCMELARRAGLDVPETRLQPTGKRRILLVRRFDVSEEGGRFHMLSFRSLCKERPGVFVIGYDGLAEALRKYSADPAADVRALFRYAAFNAAIGNVDDHLKNFWMVHRDEGWRLAPAFDLVPDTGPKVEHTLAFGLQLACPTCEVLTHIGRRWGVGDAGNVVSEVVAAAAQFPAVAKDFRVKGAASLKQIKADIERRVALLS
ncbi:MAG: type II toxin-antitoxin system HipA family toxin [Usitatibacter sp.]